MNEEEVQKMIDNSIKQEIKNHEIRVGWISGIIGSLFVFGIIHSIWLIRHWVL
jgi:hypothetical protein